MLDTNSLVCSPVVLCFRHHHLQSSLQPSRLLHPNNRPRRVHCRPGRWDPGALGYPFAWPGPASRDDETGCCRCDEHGAHASSAPSRRQAWLHHVVLSMRAYRNALRITVHHLPPKLPSPLQKLLVGTADGDLRLASFPLTATRSIDGAEARRELESWVFAASQMQDLMHELDHSL